MLQSVFFCMYLILSLYTIAAQDVEDTPCRSTTLRGPMREDGAVVPVLRVEANLYSEDPIVIRCQLNHIENSNVDYKLRLKMDFTILDEMERDWLTNQSLFNILSEGNVIYYNVSINASAMLERSVISCGAEYKLPHETHSRFCYTKSFAIIMFRDYDPCDHPTATSVATPTTPSTNSSTTTNRPTATPVTTPTTPPTNSTKSELPTTKWDPNSIPNPDKTPAPVTPVSTISETTPKVDSGEIISMNTEEFFPVVGIVILVGIALLVANVIQLWVIVRNRKTATQTTVDSVSATNDIALQLELGTETEYDVDSKTHGGESEDVSNSAITGSG